MADPARFAGQWHQPKQVTTRSISHRTTHHIADRTLGSTDFVWTRKVRMGKVVLSAGARRKATLTRKDSTLTRRTCESLSKGHKRIKEYFT